MRRIQSLVDDGGGGGNDDGPTGPIYDRPVANAPPTPPPLRYTSSSSASSSFPTTTTTTMMPPPTSPSDVDYELYIEDDEEWYLPPSSVTTILYGTGDPSEWGSTSYVNGTSSSSSYPISRPVSIDVSGLSLQDGEHAIQVSAGTTHSALLTSEGRIFTSGSGHGLGRDADAPDDDYVVSRPFAPVTVFETSTSSTSSTPFFVKVVASDGYTLGIDVNGNVWSTGNNDAGQSCHADDTGTTSIDHFRMVNITSATMVPVIDVALGARHTLLLMHDGTVYGCGWNAYGQLGLGVAGGDDDGGDGGNDYVIGPTRIVFDDVLVDDAAKLFDEDDDEDDEDDDEDEGLADAAFELGLGLEVDGGSAWTDTNSSGMTTTTTTTDGIAAASSTADEGTIVGLAAGRGSSYFLTSTGRVYASGTNYRGQLCLGHRRDVYVPTFLGTITSYLEYESVDGDFSLSDEGVRVVSVTASDSSVYLLLSNGIVLACGENSRGELGIGEYDDRNDDGSVIDSVDAPVPISHVTNVTAVFSGPTSHGATILEGNGAMYSFGHDGSGARENWYVPVETNFPCPGDEGGGGSASVSTSASRAAGTGGGGFVIVSMGNDHALYLASTHASFGCEGDDHDVPTSAPSTTPYRPSYGRPTQPPRPSSAFPTPIFAGGGSIGPTIVESSLPTITTAPSGQMDTSASNAADGRLIISSTGGMMTLSLVWHYCF
jgi:alpha-tubulin suppressor-like RCC1 family protein